MDFRKVSEKFWEKQQTYPEYGFIKRRRLHEINYLVPIIEGLQPDHVVDLGCGDGRVLRQAWKNYKVKAIGFEVNLMAYLKAQVLSIGLKQVKIKRKSFWSQNLARADVIFCYLYPDVMRKLSTKLKTELKPGTLVVSCNFSVPGFKPLRVLRPKGSLHSDPLYIYRV